MFTLLKDLPVFPAVEQAYAFGEFHHVVMNEGYNKEQFKQYLESIGHSGLQLQPVRPTIEDCFMQLMQHQHG